MKNHLENLLPEAGKIYFSTKFKGFIIETVEIDFQPERFFIHAIDKSHDGDNQLFLMWQEEWFKGKFKPAPCHP